ncbi:hypothetical protein LRR81_14915 [Metabacillus sp. GX 13764]|uniref:hypothetical protein n=1 Tax=Metabacillus kandeliae TaxID=2900151 RepID=UPI001E3A47FF|nr:hypothetical protein [Metabacillus kandeliae]MCD7035535.1 hypothetical protein [Metabacillus kandeliae]
MIGWLILGCEIGFWVFVLAGLASRYLLKKKKLGAILLFCTPIVDLILAAATVIDLKNGAQADTFHGLAAIYIGTTIAFGHQMIAWMDERFAYRFGDGSKPKKKAAYGKDHAKKERTGWLRHLLAWTIGCLFLAGMIFFINDAERTAALQQLMLLWTIILGADFLYSFSFTLWPRKENTHSA